MYPSGYTQDTSRYIRIRILITNPPKLDNKPPRSRGGKPRPTQQPQARSRPLPAADSEEAAPSEPDPASTRSQSASPRLLDKAVGYMYILYRYLYTAAFM